MPSRQHRVATLMRLAAAAGVVLVGGVLFALAWGEGAGFATGGGLSPGLWPAVEVLDYRIPAIVPPALAGC